MQAEQHHILWSKCLSIIKDNVGEKHFETWFKPIVPLSYKDDKFTIQVPSMFFYEYIEEKYSTLLNWTLKRVLENNQFNLDYVVGVAGKAEQNITLPAGNEVTSSQQAGQVVNVPNLFASKARQDWDSHLIAKYSFDNYFEGVSNRAVRSSSEAIAKEPGKTLFNPMFVYGASGVGKTHLCHAIGNRIQEIHPDKKVLYVSAHLFTIQYTDAVRKNMLNDFMYFYQGVDVLILDDIQELIGKDKTQNTFFHIFNHLHLLGKQLILTSDKAPVDLQGIEERLITRLKWGVTLEMERPDLDLRKKILKNKISHDGVQIPEDVFDLIASNVTENVRDVEGIVASLLAHWFLWMHSDPSLRSG